MAAATPRGGPLRQKAPEAARPAGSGGGNNEGSVPACLPALLFPFPRSLGRPLKPGGRLLRARQASRSPSLACLVQLPGPSAASERKLRPPQRLLRLRRPRLLPSAAASLAERARGYLRAWLRSTPGLVAPLASETLPPPAGQPHAHPRSPLTRPALPPTAPHDYGGCNANAQPGHESYLSEVASAFRKNVFKAPIQYMPPQKEAPLGPAGLTPRLAQMELQLLFAEGLGCT
ncbi:uncharacterized protein LOC133389718 [Rhineura floridana]|uniref:uncharacterized protein LOC133389718 n=1 Tax=Rhineura floridana TaxID=261503 RepID=UPI002AC882B7|nr:uncharacterized protein LOC133389718 [Rhineura floridana]